MVVIEVDFPNENGEELIYSVSSNQDHTSIIYEEKVRCRLLETSWVNKSQSDSILRNPDSWAVDTMSKTNNQGRPLGNINATDGEIKSMLSLMSLSFNERLREFYFVLTHM